MLTQQSNQYIHSIRAIGGILSEYSSEGNVSVLGFGSSLPKISKVSNCFALNGDIYLPEVKGIDEVVNTYQNNLSKLSFSEPTRLSEIVRYVGDMAEYYWKNGESTRYSVLLILTSGQIADIQDTIDQIVRCSLLPFSILIIGIGKNDFRELDRLDSDMQPLFSAKLNTSANRDILRFVRYKEFSSNPSELVKKTLEKLPRQIIEYFTAANLPSLLPSPSEDVPSFYEFRKRKLLETIGSIANPLIVEQILSSGFPVEDAEEFMKEVRSGHYATLI